MTDKNIETSELTATASDIMKQLSDAFPEVAGKTFEMYASYTYASGISDIILGSICLLMLFLCLPAIFYGIKYDNESITGTSSILGIILFLLVVFSLPIGFVKVSTPEGYTIKEIVKTVSH